MTGATDDLFFDDLVRRYVADNSRFVRRDWLAAEVDRQLGQRDGRFILITAKPGAGKSVFMAQLAADHPEWLRYFIRRDQRSVLADVSDKSLLLRVGYQLAARRPELFALDSVRLSVTQDVGHAAEAAAVVGAVVKRLSASPFYQKVVEIEQRVRDNHGRLVGLEVEELVTEVRHLSVQDLQQMALIHPAEEMERAFPGEQIVVLIDALDEIDHHRTPEHILAWLANLPDRLPQSIRFVLTAREGDGALQLLRGKQASRLRELTISETDPLVQAEVRTYVGHLVAEPGVAAVLQTIEGGADTFTDKAIRKASGHLGYLDALARGIDIALAHAGQAEPPTSASGRAALEVLFRLGELPADLHGLYAFFLGQIRTDALRERVEIVDPQTGESYDKPVWPAVYQPLLSVLTVAMEPLGFEQLAALSGIRAGSEWIRHALARLLQFMDSSGGRYRFYHATVAEFLADEGAADLRIDVKRWHQRIADHYWALKGDWTRLDAYGLTHLAGHLRNAGETDRLYSLLTASWARAKYLRFHSASSYSADIDLALECAVEHDHLPALVTLGLNFSREAREIPVPALETLVVLGQGQRAADYAALLPTAGERCRALRALVPLVRDASGLPEACRLFKDQALALSGVPLDPVTGVEDEIFVLVGLGEGARARARAQALANDAAQFAAAWLSIARAETAANQVAQVPDAVEDDLRKGIASITAAHDRAGVLAAVVRLMVEIGSFEKACAWSDEALSIALTASWSDGAADVLSAVVDVLNRPWPRPVPDRIGEQALQLARQLGSNTVRVWRQKEIVPWLLRSGRQDDAFALAEHVRDLRNWRMDIRLSDDASLARGFAEEILREIGRVLLAEVADESRALARMTSQLTARPGLAEWADETSVRALLGLPQSSRAKQPNPIDDLLAMDDGGFPRIRHRTVSHEGEQRIQWLFTIAAAAAREGLVTQAAGLAIRTLTTIRERDLRSAVSGALYCQPEDVAVALIERREEGLAMKVAAEIETCPTIDPTWKVATIARTLASSGYVGSAQELVGHLLLQEEGFDEESAKACGRLVERIARSLADLGSLERSADAAAAVHNEVDRCRLFIAIADDLAARPAGERARAFTDLALDMLQQRLGDPAETDRWRELEEWESAHWLDRLTEARRVLLRLGEDAQLTRVADWMEQSIGWISSDDYRTHAQVQIAEALASEGRVERAVWLSTQTDVYDFEAKALILRTVAVARALRGQNEEAERILSSIEGKDERSLAFVHGAADLVAARSTPEAALAWARRGVAESPGTADPLSQKLLHGALSRLIDGLAGHGDVAAASDVATWIADPAYQAEAWIRISEAAQRQTRESDARIYAVRALETSAAIAEASTRVVVLKRLVEACLVRVRVSQSAALLRRSVMIVDMLEDPALQATLLAEMAGARLHDAYPELPDIATLQPYFQLEWVCAFSEAVTFIVVPVAGDTTTAAGIVRSLLVFAARFEDEAQFEELVTSGLGIVYKTLHDLNDELLLKLLASAHALAGTAGFPDARANADRFIAAARSIQGRSERLAGLTTLVSAFAKSGFAEHALAAAEEAQLLITDAGSSEFVARSAQAAGPLLESGHASEAMRLLRIALRAARWDPRTLFDALDDACGPLVQLERADDLWAIFTIVDALRREKTWPSIESAWY